jgi:hypothetical protein
VQQQVGQYRLDIVVAGPNGRLAIECDGDRWHGEDVWHRDRARQEVLERAGWTFERVRGSSFYRDPDAAMQPVWRHLNDLGIPTGDEWMVTAPRGVTREVRGTPEIPPLAKAHPASEPDMSPDIDENSSAESQFSRESEVLLVDTPVEVEEIREAPPTDHTDWTPPAWYVASVAERDEPETAQGGAPEFTESAPWSDEEFRPPAWYQPPPSGSASTDLSRESLSSAKVPTSRAAPMRAGAAVLAPYRTWTPRSVPPVDSGSRVTVMDAMAEIIEAEGPMHAHRMYQLYVRASGGQRVGKEAQRLLNTLTANGVRTGQWLRVKDRLSNPPDATLYLPGHPPVVVRERGPRELAEIPRSEIRSLIDQLGLTTSDPGVKRAVLRQLGFVRLTERTSDYLDQCLRYAWTT